MGNNKENSKLQKFLKDESGEYRTGLESYDFKFLMQEYYEYWNKKSRGGNHYEGLIRDIKKEIGDFNVENENITNIGRWLAYRTLDVIYAEKEKINFLFFDCDNSNDTCDLTKEIYFSLWGWEKYNGKFTYGDSLVWGKNNAMGGDTMNSFATTLLQYLKESGENTKSIKECKDKYDRGSLKCVLENAKLKDFAKYVSCIGNFVLVPAGFNSYRGTNKYLKDYWDLSLDYLADVKGSWLQCEDEDNGFKKYINTFFLWDYVEKKGENYQIKELFGSHKEKLESQNSLSVEKLYPSKSENKNQDEFEEFFKNVNDFIRRRGQFMIAMLKIAMVSEEPKCEYDVKEEWEDWHVSGLYKEIMKKVFLKDEVYDGYSKVIEEIEGAIKNKSDYSFVVKILDELKEKLKT